MAQARWPLPWNLRKRKCVCIPADKHYGLTIRRTSLPSLLSSILQNYVYIELPPDRPYLILEGIAGFLLLYLVDPGSAKFTLDGQYIVVAVNSFAWHRLRLQ